MQTGNNLNVIGVLFSNFLAGKNQTLQVQGNSVDPNGNGQTVSWLSTAFKTLTLNVTLPGQIFQIIDSITIEDLELVLDQPSEDFKPLTNLKTTAATFKNPWFLSSSNPIGREAEEVLRGTLRWGRFCVILVCWWAWGWVKEGMTWAEVSAKIIGAKEASESAILAVIAFLLPQQQQYPQSGCVGLAVDWALGC
ncbi:hypothetical protein BU17DRAFT_91663 [Hysterangium stoloniferum]|nr:hypothetical protein BU17DRAFT_91663 [Hysterangium stoloniferum]